MEQHQRKQRSTPALRLPSEWLGQNEAPKIHFNARKFNGAQNKEESTEASPEPSCGGGGGQATKTEKKRGQMFTRNQSAEQYTRRGAAYDATMRAVSGSKTEATKHMACGNHSAEGACHTRLRLEGSCWTDKTRLAPSSRAAAPHSGASSASGLQDPEEAAPRRLNPKPSANLLRR